MPATMVLLGLETATHRLSVALWRQDEVIERSVIQAASSSRWLLPAVHALMADAGLTLRQVDGIAFGAGPGSFTGLRLAAGCAQGLAFGLDLPVLGVGTLAALAEASGEEKVFACLDARMNEVYSAAYVGGVAVLPPAVTAPTEVPVPEGDGWVGCGDAFASYGERLPAFARIRADVWPTAAAVVRLAAPGFARGEGVAAAQALPIYVRDKVALTTAERLARGGVR
jgi:tRNA threonylcarbamoyladenosine biosynthesis protein TsaB